MIMQKYGISENMVRIVKLFYTGFQLALEDRGERGEWFSVKTGVEQGCDMSGFMFLIVWDWVMRRTVGRGEANGLASRQE